MEDKEKILLKAEAIIKEKKPEVAAVRRKVEWEMRGRNLRCRSALSSALYDVFIRLLYYEVF